MNLYFDLDNGVFTSSPGARDTVSSLSFKRGDTVSLAVRFISGIVVQELGVGAAGKLGLKEKGEYDADFVASDTAWTKTGTGSSTVYTFQLNLNTSEINALLNDDGTEGNDVASVDLMLEMEWTVSGVTTSSNTITATVHNDLWKGDEGTPTALPSPDEWLAERQAALTFAGTDPNSGALMLSGVTLPTGFNGPFVEVEQANGYPSYTSDGLSGSAIRTGAYMRLVYVASGVEPGWTLFYNSGNGVTNSTIGRWWGGEFATPDLAEWGESFGFDFIAGAPSFTAGSAIPATHLGQWCKVTGTTPDSWWRWNGTAWEEDTGGTVDLAAVLTLLGIPTFASLAAANASAAIDLGKPFYNSATAKLDITTA